MCASRRTATYLQSVRIVAFLYETTVSLIKLIFCIKNKKAADLKLQSSRFETKHSVVI